MWYMNDERLLVQAAAREFAENEIKPCVKDMENNVYQRQLVKRFGELGFTGLPFPESFGGEGGDWTTYGIVVEEVSKVSATAGLMLMLDTAMASTPIALAGTQEQKDKWLRPCYAGETNFSISMTEPTGIFNFAELHTRAELDGDEWVINGSKIFTSNAGVADFNLACALTSDFDPATFGGMSIFVVPKDTPGFEVGEIEDKLGWRGSSTGSIYYNNVRVPKENLIGELGQGALIILQMAALECMCFGPMCLGTAEAAYEKALKYTKERIQLGKSLFEAHQAVRWQLAKMRVEIETLRGLVYSTLAMMDQGIPCLEQQYMMKIKGAQVAEYVASEAIPLHGGNGVVVDYDLERFFRDAKVHAVGGGSVNTLIDTMASML